MGVGGRFYVMCVWVSVGGWSGCEWRHVGLHYCAGDYGAEGLQCEQTWGSLCLGASLKHVNGVRAGGCSCVSPFVCPCWPVCIVKRASWHERLYVFCVHTHDFTHMGVDRGSYCACVAVRVMI